MKTRECPFRVIAPIIRFVDRTLRRRQGIFEFDDDPRCVFRLSIHPFGRPHLWPDGTKTDGRQLVGELHLWNEHLADLPVDACGGELRSRYNDSFRALARHMASHPRLRSVPGIFAESWVSADHHSDQAGRFFTHFGFRIDYESDKIEFWDQLYVRLLARTFSPGMPRGPVRRVRIWIGREEFMLRYAEQAASVRAPRKTLVREPAAESERRLAGG